MGAADLESPDKGLLNHALLEARGKCTGPGDRQQKRSSHFPWRVLADHQSVLPVPRVRHGSKALCLAIPNQPLPSNSDILVARTRLILFLTLFKK